MSNRERAKGLRGERAVRELFTSCGWAWRGLEAEGDGLAFRRNSVLHVECKNQATLRLPLWVAQAESEAPSGTVPVIVYKLAGTWRADMSALTFATQYGMAS
jgi:hypothetical protein